MDITRYAIVAGARSRDELEAYLPGNYKVIWAIDTRDPDIPGGSLRFVIKGQDSAGWGLDSYVIPRLHSGLIGAEEVDLSHPVFKQIPQDAGEADFHVVGKNGDTVYLLIPRTNSGREWADANLPDDAPTLGRGIAVEWRYIDPILEGIENDGLEVLRVG